MRSDLGEWGEVADALRPVLAAVGLVEEVKWRKPCFTHDGANIAILQPMKAHLALMFFKGAVLDDPAGLLVPQGPNSRAAMRVEFTSVDQVARLAAPIRDLVSDAISAESDGRTVEPEPELELVAELRARLDRDHELCAAFEALTPGRQREYHLFVSGAKQAATRERRVDQQVDRIKAGKGLRDR